MAREDGAGQRHYVGHLTCVPRLLLWSVQVGSAVRVPHLSGGLAGDSLKGDLPNCAVSRDFADEDLWHRPLTDKHGG